MLPLIPYLGNDISSLRSHSPFIPSSYLVLYPLTPLLPYFFVYYVLICHLRGSHDRRYVTRSSSHLGVISVPLLYRRFCRLLIQLLCSLIGHPLQYLPSLGHNSEVCSKTKCTTASCSQASRPATPASPSHCSRLGDLAVPGSQPAYNVQPSP